MSITRDHLAALLKRFRQRTPLRTGSLVVTIFGDSVVPRGGVVWLGSLISALEPTGLSHRAIRTAMFRLVQDGIMRNHKVGRRSYYSLTSQGNKSFNEATQRIYASGQAPWDGQWCLLLVSALDAVQRRVLRRRLIWQGFASLTPELLAHPHPDLPAIQAELESLGLSDKVIVFSAPIPEQLAFSELVKKTWQLDSLGASYADFVTHFHPILQTLQQASLIEPEQAFYLRTFLIHEYRRILLRDPGLPRDLLPSDWPGNDAKLLTAQAYRLLAEASEAYIDEAFENQAGPLPTASCAFSDRFGGL